MTKLLAIDLFCGLGGWTESLLAEGWGVIGFDIEQHEYGEHRYPGSLVIQDVRTLHGSQFKDAALIVASPPCQEYSYMAMPWTRAKQIAQALRGEDEFPGGYTGSHTIAELNALFDACFRIQCEACEAAGHHIPLIVENVRGAIPWVGRSRWNFGSFHLWGDVPALMPNVSRIPKQDRQIFRDGHNVILPQVVHRDPEAHKVPGQKFNPDGTNHGQGSWFKIADSKNRGIKQHGSGREWFSGEGAFGRPTSSKSIARKRASAMIAKIPQPLARHIAVTFRREARP